MMRVAIVANTSWYLANFRLGLMRELKKSGFDIIGVAPDGESAQKIRDEGFRFEALPITGSGTNPLVEVVSVFRLYRLFRGQKIDLVLSYTPKGNLYSAIAAILLGVIFVPNISGLGRSFIHQSIVTFFVRILYRVTLGRAKKVFFQNYDDLRVFVDGGLVAEHAAERLPGSGVDLSRFVPGASDGVQRRGRVFILIARMLWDKGVGEYVEASRRLKREFPDSRFQLLGFLDVANPSAVSRAEVQEWVDEGIIEYLGETDDVRPWVAAADCVVLPSYREGVPRTLLEAAAMAKPIVTTDAPGCRDTVVNLKSGFICQPRDANDLCEKMKWIVRLSDEALSEMGLEGRRYVEANFDEKIVLRRYVEVAEGVALDLNIRN